MANENNNTKQNGKNLKKPLSGAEREAAQNKRNQDLLVLGGRDARVVIANTVESKELLSKFIRVDVISKKSRELVGNKLSIAEFTKLNELFSVINETLDEVIDFGSKNGLFFDPKAQKFETLKQKLIKALEDGKNVSDISKELNVDTAKITSWIKLLDSEENKNSVDIASTSASEKAAPKKVEKTEKTEKIS